MSFFSERLLKQDKSKSKVNDEIVGRIDREGDFYILRYGNDFICKETSDSINIYYKGELLRSFDKTTYQHSFRLIIKEALIKQEIEDDTKTVQQFCDYVQKGLPENRKTRGPIGYRDMSMAGDGSLQISDIQYDMYVMKDYMLVKYNSSTVRLYSSMSYCVTEIQTTTDFNDFNKILESEGVPAITMDIYSWLTGNMITQPPINVTEKDILELILSKAPESMRESLRSNLNDFYAYVQNVILRY